MHVYTHIYIYTYIHTYICTHRHTHIITYSSGNGMGCSKLPRVHLQSLNSDLKKWQTKYRTDTHPWWAMLHKKAQQFYTRMTHKPTQVTTGTHARILSVTKLESEIQCSTFHAPISAKNNVLVTHVNTVYTQYFVPVFVSQVYELS